MEMFALIAVGVNDGLPAPMLEDTREKRIERTASMFASQILHDLSHLNDPLTGRTVTVNVIASSEGTEADFLYQRLRLAGLDEADALHVLGSMRKGAAEVAARSETIPCADCEGTGGSNEFGGNCPRCNGTGAIETHPATATINLTFTDNFTPAMDELKDETERRLTAVCNDKPVAVADPVGFVMGQVFPQLPFNPAHPNGEKPNPHPIMTRSLAEMPRGPLAYPSPLQS